MENNEKEIMDSGDNTPIEADDFSVNENEKVETDGQKAFEPSLPSEEAAQLRAGLEEQKDKYVRLFAEFDNYKRRSAKERLDLVQTAGKEVLSSLLQVLDDTDRAEKQMQETDDPEHIREGVQLVFNKLRKTLKSKGLEPMESVGTNFDVDKHEAISEVPVDDKKQKGKVVAEIEKGYYLNDKLIRFTKMDIRK